MTSKPRISRPWKRLSQWVRPPHQNRTQKNLASRLPETLRVTDPPMDRVRESTPGRRWLHWSWPQVGVVVLRIMG